MATHTHRCLALLGLVLFDSGLIANPICTIRCRNCYDESSTGMGGVVAVEQRKSKRYKMTAEQNRVLCCIVYGSIECILLSCARVNISGRCSLVARCDDGDDDGGVNDECNYYENSLK